MIGPIKRKSYTAHQWMALLCSQEYSVPEVAYRWGITPAEVCELMENYDQKPTVVARSHGWTIWGFTGEQVDIVERSYYDAEKRNKPETRLYYTSGHKQARFNGPARAYPGVDVRKRH